MVLRSAWYWSLGGILPGHLVALPWDKALPTDAHTGRSVLPKASQKAGL